MSDNISAASVDIESIKSKAIAVITKPVEFYRAMPATGGLKDPVIFLVVMSLITGIIRAILAIFSSIGIALGALILTPVFALIFGFVGAAIVFVIWKLMGSSQNYETAYRCLAYASAIMPINTLLSLVPYLGGVAASAWGFYLVYVASIEVHRISAQRAKLVWGILFAVSALLGISAEAGSRRMQRDFSDLQQQLNQEDMTPEQAGEIMGQFLKGLEKGAEPSEQ